MARKEEIIELKPINIKTAFVTIEGDTDLVLNKMDNVTKRQLIGKRKNKAQLTEDINEWEKIITSIAWRDGDPKEFSEQTLIDALKNNAPCISAIGLKKSFAEAVCRNKIDKNKTNFEANVNVVGPKNLIPITFLNHYVDEMLMSPKQGAPVLVRLNKFSNWKATFQIQYLDNVFSLEQIVNIINLAGFGIGIGSERRNSGFGRYHVIGVE